MVSLERYKKNIEYTLNGYEDKSFEELLERADEITAVLDTVEDLMKELIIIQGVMTARILNGDIDD